MIDSRFPTEEELLTDKLEDLQQDIRNLCAIIISGIAGGDSQLTPEWILRCLEESLQASEEGK
jgi:hypothetical protein